MKTPRPIPVSKLTNFYNLLEKRKVALMVGLLPFIPSDPHCNTPNTARGAVLGLQFAQEELLKLTNFKSGGEN